MSKNTILEWEPEFTVHYKDYLAAFKSLTNNQAGILFKAIVEYSDSGEKPYFKDKLLEALFEAFTTKSNHECQNCMNRCNPDGAHFLACGGKR